MTSADRTLRDIDRLGDRNVHGKYVVDKVELDVDIPDDKFSAVRD